MRGGMRSLLLTSVCLVSASFFACSSSDDAPAGSAGSGGSAAAGTAGKGPGGGGTPNSAGEGGASGTDEAGGTAGEAGAAGSLGGSTCAETGTGDIDLFVTGLPQTVAARVSISGPHEALESEGTTLNDVPSGSYTVTAERVYDADPLVRTVYDPKVEGRAFCLDDGGNASATVSYTKVPPSNQLWALVRTHGPVTLLGFASAKLSASGSPAPSSAVELPLIQAIAFDHTGAVWGVGLGPEPGITRYAPSWLGGGGEPHADYQFALPFPQCPPPSDGALSTPAINNIALDARENIWLSTCNNKVLRIDRPVSAPGSSQAVEQVAPQVTLSGFTAPSTDLAFDSNGNLWVATGGHVLRFDRARLDHDDAEAPDLTLAVATDDATPTPLSATFLTFDVLGNLWVTDVVDHTLFEISKTDLAAVGTQTVVPKARHALGDSSVLARPAFDDQGSLWLSLASGSLGKLSADQLAAESPEPSVPSLLISNLGVDPDALAFFPAAAGLPLPSAQP